jgi:hypothetical protein
MGQKSFALSHKKNYFCQMLKRREDIRSVNFDSIIAIAIVFFGLLIYSDSVRNTTGLSRKPVPTYISVNEKCAVFSPYEKLQVFQKTWISNKDHFSLLAFNRNEISENKKTGIRVLHLQIISRSKRDIPQFILRYHLFPEEIDEPVLLS